jgi:hypothetical protein
MSLAVAREYLEKNGIKKDDVNYAEHVETGKSVGLDFTEAELQVALVASSELDDESLEKIAGGGVGNFPTPIDIAKKVPLY